MLKLNDVTKIYQTASKEKVTALSNVSLSLDKNGLVFIVGQSGSGKTTLLNLIGGLDMPEQGEILVDELVLGRDISLEKYRQNYVGFVFQEYNLLENLSVYENIAMEYHITGSNVIQKSLERRIILRIEQFRHNRAYLLGKTYRKDERNSRRAGRGAVQDFIASGSGSRTYSCGSDERRKRRIRARVCRKRIGRTVRAGNRG